jgi:hypothetical protein
VDCRLNVSYTQTNRGGTGTTHTKK